MNNPRLYNNNIIIIFVY